jgi:hypothetical protein
MRASVGEVRGETREVRSGQASDSSREACFLGLRKPILRRRFDQDRLLLTSHRLTLTLALTFLVARKLGPADSFL